MSKITNQNYPNGLNPLGYMGVNAPTPGQQVVQLNRAPTTTDSQNFTIGTQWLATVGGVKQIWELVDLAGGVATWVQLFPGGGGGANSFPTDNGTANEVSGVLNVFGDSININTVGSGDTVTVNLDSHITVDAITVSSFGAGVITSNGAGLLSSVDPLPIALGGTNATSMATTDGTVYYDGTRLVTTATGSAGQVLTSNGAGVAPTYQASGVNPAASCAFLCRQTATAVNVTGDGTVYDLGSAQVLVKIFDLGNNIYVGSGAGAAATFTAPATGYYYLEINVAVQSNSVGKVTATPIPSIAISGVVNRTFTHVNPAILNSNTNAQIANTSITLTNMNVGDVATFSVEVNTSGFPALDANVIDGGSANPLTWISGYRVA